MVEYERVGGKKMEKGEREGRRINMRTAILSLRGDGGQPFLLPPREC